MFLRKKKWLILLVSLFCMIALVSGCGNDSVTNTPGNDDSADAKVPTLNMAWDFDLHGSALLAAVVKGEDFADSGYYLKELINKEQYELYQGDKLLAVINTIVTKGSSETAVMMGQGQIDMCVNSSTGMMSAKDQGTDIQMLCPIHVDGISLVFPAETGISGWKQVEAYIKAADQPVKIGYHSPVSAPRVLIQKALVDAGINVSEDPDSQDADVILINLNGSKNLLPAFSSNLVDAWVAPSHYPETAEHEGIGEIALKLSDFPPEGQWYDFPCCVYAARTEIIEQYPEVIKGMTALLTYSADWCQNNRNEAAPILAEIIGIPVEVVENAQIVFTTNPTDKWMEGEALYVDMLNQLGIFEGDIKGKTFDDVKDELFNFSFLQ
ncbi:MAG: ABC transporter substrate-binding protein [Syntrophomonadaceae bacterium]|nr:ABC transporter substrate-binding protein [Syntrophomonadaceae bacterium]